MKLILKSRLILLKEELCVLAEEADFIYDICKYHEGKKTNEPSLKKDLEINFQNLSIQIFSILEEIHGIDERIKRNLLEKNNTDELRILFLIDFYQKEINKTIQKLKLINGKISQMFRDGYNQYIPKPTPGRMVSNINMTSQVEKSLTHRLGKLLGGKNDDINFSSQIIWEYTKSYRITHYKRDKKDKYDFQTAFFRMSYWYFDLPYLIPALTHEISHIALDEKSNREKVQEISTNIKTKILSQKDELFKKRIIKLEFFDNIIEEIIADIFSLIHHGTSYVFTMSHELLGYYLANTFDYNETIQNLTIAPWLYNDKRDNSFIRLSVIIFFNNFLKKARENGSISCNEKLFSLKEEQLVEIQDLLNIIYPTKSSKNIQTIENYYNNWHNFRPEYIALKEFILFFIEQVKSELLNKEKWFIEVLNNTKANHEPKCKPLFIEAIDRLTNKHIEPSKINLSYECNIDDNKETKINCEVPQFYNDLWEMRLTTLKYDKVPHKAELRKKIHRKTIENLVESKRLNIDEIQPYILTFSKYKVDTDNLEDTNLSYTATLGIYDSVKIEKQPQFFFPKVEDVALLRDNEKEKYTLKFSLMKILKDIEGFSKNKHLNIIIQMEIDKEIVAEDTYKDLTNKLSDLYDYFEENKSLYGNVEFFKSLGPKDITVNITGMDIESIYTIKADLADTFQRTFTTIYYEKDKSEYLKDIKSSKTYGLATEVRLSSKSKFKVADENIRSKMKKCSMIPGVMDYHIEWKESTSLQTIEDFYTEMRGKRIVTDIQTLFIKNIKIEDLNK